MDTAQTGTKVDYYFSAISSFAYLGHWAFQDLAKRLSLSVTYRPVQLGKLFGGSGGLPLGERHPARNRNRMLELQRWAAHRGLEMNFQPKFFPTNPALADCAIIALQQQGHDPAELMGRVMRKIWIEDANIAERDVVADCIAACGEDADALLAKAQSDTIVSIYDSNSQQGLELDIIGSPSVVFQGEPFWGQDRFGLLEEAITSNRPAFSGAP